MTTILVCLPVVFILYVEKVWNLFVIQVSVWIVQGHVVIELHETMNGLTHPHPPPPCYSVLEMKCMSLCSISVVVTFFCRSGGVVHITFHPTLDSPLKGVPVWSMLLVVWLHVNIMTLQDLPTCCKEILLFRPYLALSYVCCHGDILNFFVWVRLHMPVKVDPLHQKGAQWHQANSIWENW